MDFLFGDEIQPGGFDHALDKHWLYARHQGFEAVDTVVQQVIAEIGPGQVFNIEKLFRLAGQFWQYRFQKNNQLAKTIQPDAADILNFGETRLVTHHHPWLFFIDVLIDLVGQRHDVAHGSGKLTVFVGFGDALGGREVLLAEAFVGKFWR